MPLHGRPTSAPQQSRPTSSSGRAPLAQVLVPSSSQQIYAPAWSSQQQPGNAEDWSRYSGGAGAGATAPSSLSAGAHALPRAVAALRASISAGGRQQPGLLASDGRPGSAPDARQLLAAAAGASRLAGRPVRGGLSGISSVGGRPAALSLLQEMEARPHAPGCVPAPTGLRRHVEPAPSTAGVQEAAHGTSSGELPAGTRPASAAGWATALPPPPSSSILVVPPSGAGGPAPVAGQLAAPPSRELPLGTAELDQALGALAQLGGRMAGVEARCTSVHEGLGSVQASLAQQGRRLEDVGNACKEVQAGVAKLTEAVVGVSATLERLLAKQPAAAAAAAPAVGYAVLSGPAQRPHSGGRAAAAAPRPRSVSPCPSAAAGAVPLPRQPQTSSGSGGSKRTGTGAAPPASGVKKHPGGRRTRLLQQAASMPGQQLLRFGPAVPLGAALAAAAQPQPRVTPGAPAVDAAAAATTDAAVMMSPFGDLRALVPGIGSQPDPSRSCGGRRGALRSWRDSLDTGGSSSCQEGGGGEEEDEEAISRQLAARLASHRSKRLRRMLASGPSTTQPLGC
jgi:hypothetical protein